MTVPRDSLAEYLWTERLTLELFNHSNEHYECLIAVMNTPTAHAAMGDFGIRTKEQFDALCDSTRVSSRNMGGEISDTAIYYLIHVGGKSGPLAGGVSLAQRGKMVPPDMGWCLLEKFMGKGYATEATRRFLKYVKDELGCHEIVCWPASGNLRSVRVAEKVGFREGNSIHNADTGNSDIVYYLPNMKMIEEAELSLRGQ